MRKRDLLRFAARRRARSSRLFVQTPTTAEPGLDQDAEHGAHPTVMCARPHHSRHSSLNPWIDILSAIERKYYSIALDQTLRPIFAPSQMTCPSIARGLFFSHCLILYGVYYKHIAYLHFAAQNVSEKSNDCIFVVSDIILIFNIYYANKLKLSISQLINTQKTKNKYKTYF